MAKKYTAFGKTLTAKEWFGESENVHESYNTLRYRLAKFEPEEAISGGRIVLHEYNGISATWGDWQKDPPRKDINWKTVRNRITSGMSFQNAIDEPVKEIVKLETINGVTKTRTEWLDDPICKASQGTVFKRLKNGMDFEEAITLDIPENLKPVKYNAFDKSLTLHSWTDQPECVVDSDSTLHSRINKFGFTLEDALTIPVNIKYYSEDSLAEYIQSLGFEVARNSRQIIPPKELDIFIPEKNFAIEFNGLYWHTEDKVGQKYHNQKYVACKSKGIRLIQIWEDDWKLRKDIVQLMLASKLGVSNSARVYARNCELDREITIEEARVFLDSSHIQGFSSATYRFGLRFEGRLVALCLFRKEGDGWDLVRYATNCSVVGGFSRLLKNFREDFSGPIKTFADLTLSDGDLYYKTGFELDKIIPPDYSYIVNGERVHKFFFRKEKFKKNPNFLYQDGLTESELAKLNNLKRIYDAGKARFILR